MKWYNYIAATLLTGAVLVGCAKLDTEPTGSTVTSKQKEEVVKANPGMVSASVSGITAMFSVYMNTIDGDHTDFGYPCIMLALDSRGADLVSEDIGYNWFGRGLDLISDRTFNYRQTLETWSTLYNQIYACNQVVGTFDKDEVAQGDDDIAKFYLAQALAIRAFDYFNLAQIYQFNYKGNESLPCVPLILDTNADDVAINGAPRASVQEVYDQILADIDLAVSLLEGSAKVREDRRYLDAATAHGLRARIYLVMQEWQKALDDANAAIAATDATPKALADASKPTFKDITEEDWMWGIIIAETDRVVTSGIVNWPSHMGSLNYGYASVGAWRRVSKKLYASIPDTDVRKGWFLDASGKSVNLTAEQQAYVTSEAGCPPYTQVKFAPYKDELYTSTNANDIMLMRVEEMILIKAECEARLGNAEAATTLANFVTTYRDPSFTVDADAQAVLAATLLQRRIELWGEGISYFDLLRLGNGIDRRGAGFEDKFIFKIDGNDPLMIYQLPKSEIEGNPMLTDADNNETADSPDPVKE